MTASQHRQLDMFELVIAKQTAKNLHRTTEEEVDRMIAAYLGGMTLTEAAALIGFGRHTCKDALKRRGISKRDRHVTDDSKRIMIEAYLAGSSMKDAAAIVGHSEPSCAQALKDAGLYQRTEVVVATPEQRNRFVLLYQSGQTIQRAAEEVGITYAIGQKELTKRGIQTRLGGTNLWSEEREQDFVARFPKEGQVPLSEEYGLSTMAINSKAKRMGLKSKNHYKHLGKALSVKNTSVNWRYFETWSPSMAWVLGYVWADGCVRDYALRLGCCTDDEILLNMVQKELGSDYTIKHFPARVNSEGYLCRPFSRVNISSVLLADSLKGHGVMPRKSYLDLPFPNVPVEYLGHFARGLLDGDGTVYLSKSKASVSFLGSYTFILGLQAAICQNLHLPKLSVCRRKRKGKETLLTVITWTAKKDIKALREWMYPSGNYPFLPRKRTIIETIRTDASRRGAQV